MIELIIVVVVIGSITLLMGAGVRLFARLQRETLRLHIERDAQVTMHEIITDLYNSKRVVDMGWDRISLETYDFKRYGYHNIDPILLNDFFTNIGTITYQYHNVPQGTALTRSIVFGGVNRGEEESFRQYAQAAFEHRTDIPNDDSLDCLDAIGPGHDAFQSGFFLE